MSFTSTRQLHLSARYICMQILFIHFDGTLHMVIQLLSENEKIVIGGDLEIVGKGCQECERVNGGWDYGERNDAGERILEFAEIYDLDVVHTLFG